MKQLFYLATILLFFAGCTKNDDQFEEINIEFGTVGGWCVGTEKIIIEGDHIFYRRDIPCGDNRGTVIKSNEFSSDEWGAILGSYDHDDFLNLDLNSCRVCADGCDEWIKITKNSITHEIRYPCGETIEGMETLREILQDFVNVSKD